MKPKDPLIQIKLSDFLNSHLGNQDYCTIPNHLAEYLEAVGQNLLTLHIQWSDEYGRTLPTPVIWRYHKWADSVERWEKAKIKSEQQRIEKFIFDANVDIVAKQLMKEPTMMDEVHARGTAFSLMKKGKMKAIVALGVSKLITNESEL